MRFWLLLVCLWIFPASAVTKMVVSSRPIYDILNQVKTDDLELSLIAQNSHSHNTELLPKDKLVMNESDVLLAIEPFDASLIKAANQLNKKVIVLNGLSQHILPLRIEGHDDHEHAAVENHATDDPHFWLSPLVVQDVILWLKQEYPTMIDNDEYSEFEDYIANYKQALTIGVQPRWVVYHDGWQYLENYFGFDVPLFFTQNPQGLIRPNDFKKVQEQMREGDVKCMIIEPQTAQRVAAGAKNNLNIDVIILDPTGRTAPKGSNSLYWIWDEYMKAAKSCSDLQP
ncbi:MAG: metal ABC transporter substrate-binding protein [Alphaproteobacteria bacterium]